MKVETRNLLFMLSILLAAITLLLYVKFTHSFGGFSDAFKFAGVANNIIAGKGYVSDFSFFGNSIFGQIQSGNYFDATGVLPITPLVMSLYFKIFGSNDLSVVLTSATFYTLTCGLTYLLGKKLFGTLAGLLASIVVAFSPFMLDYASSGASETLFMFEIILMFFLLSLDNKKAVLISLITMIFMYFTRPQSFVFIAAGVLYYLLRTYKLKKALTYFLAISLVGAVVDLIILKALSGNMFIYSFLARGSNALSQIPVAGSPSEQLRGAATVQGSILDAGKKVFYNLYNFYRLLPQIMSPYLSALFVIALIIKEENKKLMTFKVSVIFAVVCLFISTALSIPFFRYLHAVVPLIYIIGVGGLVAILRKFVNKRHVIPISFAIIAIFVLGQTLGVIFLDSRSNNSTLSAGKPQVYKELALTLSMVTEKDDVVVTNLDTWGSWYGDRKTVWFPLTPEQLKDPKTANIPFDAIYLTNYRMDDENYYMGDEWKEIFNNPQSHGNEFFNSNFNFVGEYTIPASETYENTEGRAVLFVKK